MGSAVIATGLLLSWVGYFFHFQKISAGSEVATLYEQIRRQQALPVSYFSEMAAGILQLPVRAAERILIIIGSLITIAGFTFLQIVVRPRAFAQRPQIHKNFSIDSPPPAALQSVDVSFMSMYSAAPVTADRDTNQFAAECPVDAKSRSGIATVFVGAVVLLISYPVVFVWAQNQPDNKRGPIIVGLLLAIAGWLVVTIGAFRIRMLRSGIVPGNRWMWISLLSMLSFGVFAGALSFYIGAAVASKSGGFGLGLTLMICSVVFVLVAVLLGVIGYAKEKHRSWELETIIERRDAINQRRRRAKVVVRRPPLDPSPPVNAGADINAASVYETAPAV